MGSYWTLTYKCAIQSNNRTIIITWRHFKLWKQKTSVHFSALHICHSHSQLEWTLFSDRGVATYFLLVHFISTIYDKSVLYWKLNPLNIDTWRYLYFHFALLHLLFLKLLFNIKNRFWNPNIQLISIWQCSDGPSRL